MHKSRLLDSVSRIDHTKPQWAKSGVIIGYHRTFAPDHAYSIKYDKYRPGRDSLYGAGFYATYTLAAQDTPRMRQFYGNYIVRLNVDLRNYLIMDKSLQKKLHRPSVYQQLINKRVKFQQALQEFIGSKFIATYLADETKNSSHRLKTIISVVKDLPDKFAGVVFTGDTDGPVVLAYDLATVQVVDYATFGKQHDINNLNWYSFNQEFARDANGNNFVDRIMTKAMRLAINPAMFYLQNSVGRLSRRERRFFLYYLAGKHYRSIGLNKNPVIAWLLSPASDDFFTKLFADVLTYPPLPRFKHYKLGKLPPRPPCFLVYLADQQELIKNSFTLRLFSKVGRIKLDEFSQDWHDNLYKFFHELLQPSNKASLILQLRQMLHLVMDYLALSYKLFPLTPQEKFLRQVQHWLLNNPELAKLDKKWRNRFLAGLAAAINMRHND